MLINFSCEMCKAREEGAAAQKLACLGNSQSLGHGTVA